MRICFVAEEFISIPSGRGRRICETAKQLAKEHEVHIFCHRYPYAPKESFLDGIHVHRVGMVHSATSSLERILSSVLFLPSILRAGRFDIINTNLLFPPVISYIAAKLTKTPIIFTSDGLLWRYVTSFGIANEYGTTANFFGSSIEDLDFKLNYDAYIAVSDGVQNEFISMDVNHEQTFVAYNGVNLKFYDSFDAKEREHPTVCYIGHLETRKNVLDLITAFDLVLQKISSAQLVIVGSGSLMNKAKQTVKNLGISKSVTFTGQLAFEDAAKILKSSHVLVLPSVVEGFGLVLAEAGACRKPVVAYDVQCVREVVQDRVNGFLVQPKNLDMLAERIVTLLANKKLRETMGNNGRKIVEEKFTWENAAQTTLKIYHQTLEKTCPHRNLLKQQNSEMSLTKIAEKPNTYLDYLVLKRYFEAEKIKVNLDAKNVLDIGCNVGCGTKMLDAIGVDIDRKMVLSAKKQGLKVIRCNAKNLPFRPSTFDMVTCFEVIEHVNKPHQVLNEIFQALIPEGTMLLTTPNKNFLKMTRPLARRKKPDFHVREYTFKQLKNMVKDADFVKIKIRGMGAWMPNFLVQKFPEFSDYLGKIRLNYTFSCTATKPAT